MVGPYSNMTSALKPKGKFGHREGSCHVMAEAEIKCCYHKTRNAWGYPRLEEARKNPPVESSEKT